jgi:hypothetical protein
MSMLLLLLLLVRSHEPSYSGKTLTQWLLNTNADAVWMPNDFYGHIHDEFWARLLPSSDSDTNSAVPQVTQAVTAPDEQTLAIRAIGTNGIPRLLELMSSEPTPWSQMRSALAARLPARWEQFIYPLSARTIFERRRVAAYNGFDILGSNAVSALPVLSDGFLQGRTELERSCAIAAIGPKGVSILTNALSSTNAAVRDSAALALGLQYEYSKSALPALLNCLDDGYASYHVLGALGRIGCDDPRLVPALIRLLKSRGVRANLCLHDDMAFLLLALQGEKAREAASLVITEYQRVANDPTASAGRRFYRRILKTVAPDAEAQLPAPSPGEESMDWP